MEGLRHWLLSVTCAALMAALADSLMPKGGVKQVGRLACALVLLCAVLRPVVRMEVPRMGAWSAGLGEELGSSRGRLEENSGQMLKTLIERECAAYIVDKAAELGAECLARVECVPGDGGIWLPSRAYVTGQLDAGQRKQLLALVHSELGIPPEGVSAAGGE